MSQQKLPQIELSIRAARRRPPGAAPAAARSKPEASRSRSASRIAELERELEAARTELENSKAHAEADNRAKSRSLSAASHDLRQPLQTLDVSVRSRPPAFWGPGVAHYPG
jgi:signal transduction histidine kinase